MSRRDWWIGIGVVAFAIIIHALVPGFEWWSRNGVNPLPSADPTEEILVGTAMPTLPSTGADVAPAVLGGTTSSCTIDRSVHSRSVAQMGAGERRALGRMRISNGTGSDAVAVLVHDPDGAPGRAIFIRAGKVGVIGSVPSGRYRLRFHRGLPAGSPGDRRFCRPTGGADPHDTFDFSEVVSDGVTQYVTYEVTLHPVSASTARASHSPVQFAPSE
jgi:hypothetical protein